MSQILWTCYFLEAQGYQVKDLVIYQDNLVKSTPTLYGMERACQEIKAGKRQFSRYQIHLGDLCMGHKETRSEQKDILFEKALILYTVENVTTHFW